MTFFHFLTHLRRTLHIYTVFYCLKICSAPTSWFLILLGHYLYVEMDHGKHLDAGILESPIFPAPDASLWNSSSLIYGKCQVSPQYWTFFSQSYKRWRTVVQFCSHQINFFKVRVVPRPSFKFYLINIVHKLSTICLILLLIILNKKCLKVRGCNELELRWYWASPYCGVLPIKINNKIKYNFEKKNSQNCYPTA